MVVTIAVSIVVIVGLFCLTGIICSFNDRERDDELRAARSDFSNTISELADVSRKLMEIIEGKESVQSPSGIVGDSNLPRRVKRQILTLDK
jgi:hypothetical protein